MAASIQTLMDRRLRSVAYLRDVFAGERHFLSVTCLSADSQAAALEGIDENQVRRWFYLGVSLSTILPQQASAPIPDGLAEIQNDGQQRSNRDTDGSDADERHGWSDGGSASGVE